MHPLLATWIGNAIPATYSALDIGRSTPAPLNTNDAKGALDTGFDTYLNDINPGAKASYNRHLHTPRADGPEHFQDVFTKGLHYAGSGIKKADGIYDVNINPNADRAYYAHELGHIAAQETKVGGLIRSARSNPKVARALGAAMMIAPGAAATLTPGDDDMATSIALAYAANAPTILDEIGATHHGLGIMNTADMRATMGQRGKLATALLTYLGVPLLTGVATNTAGNFIDQDLPQPQSSS